MTDHDRWLDPPDDPEVEPQQDEPVEPIDETGDWGSDEIERIRDKRYDH